MEGLLSWAYCLGPKLRSTSGLMICSGISPGGIDIPMTTARSEGERLDTLLEARFKSSNLPLDPEVFNAFPDGMRPQPGFAPNGFRFPMLRSWRWPFFASGLLSCPSLGPAVSVGGFEKFVTTFKVGHLDLFELSSRLTPHSPFVGFCIGNLCWAGLPFCCSCGRRAGFFLFCGGLRDGLGVVGDTTSSPIGEEKGMRG